jgi:hypothetical protein
VFQVLPARDNANPSAEVFDAAVEMVRKIEEFGQKAGRMALYTAAREYFESASATENSASTAIDVPSTAGDDDVIPGGVETFSIALVVQILEEAPIDRDTEQIRLARIRMVEVCVRQSASAARRSSAASAARGRIDKILTTWRTTERSRPIREYIDNALQANKQTRPDSY